MQQGIECVRNGRFPEAAAAFAKAVDHDPDAAPARVNLAYALQQCGRESEAVHHLMGAATLDDGSFDAHYMLGLALEVTDRAQAAHHLQRAWRIRQDLPRAASDLARVLTLLGRASEAGAVLDDALSRDPKDPDLLCALGNLLLTSGDAHGALVAYNGALAARPGDAALASNRASALRHAGRLEEAIASFDAAIALGTVSADVHAERGRALQAAGRLSDAQTAYRQAVHLAPGDANLLNHLGSALQAQGQSDEAIRCYQAATVLAPDMPGPIANLGLAFYEQGRIVEAIVEYRKALAIRPIPEAHDNLGIALQKQGALDEAIVHYEQAIALAPDNKNTRCNLAAALGEGGHPRESSDAYRHILAIHPDHFVAHSNLLFNLSVDPAVSSEAYLAESARYDAKVSGRGSSAFVQRAHSTGKVRIGFVSGDLRTHPVGFFLEGVLAHVDRERFELFAYSTIAYEDALTQRLKTCLAGWCSLKGMSDPVACQRIRDDRIDVLFDLAGHTSDNRLPVFAMRAAPVQVSWLGYFASTGVRAMDYVLADEVCAPPGSDHHFSETLWRLPRTRLCYTPPTEWQAPRVMPLPALTSGHLTFGCYQRLSKINEHVLDLWARVLVAVPKSRLRLQAYQTGRSLYVERTLGRLRDVGIGADRVKMVAPTPRDAYLQSYGDVDVVLDTFPFNGGTTTCEALWMGVPTLTLEGRNIISRQGAAMLRAADLPDWVATDADDFVAKAVRHCSDVERLSALRASLRERARGSALFDTKAFAAEWERAVEGMACDRRHAASRA